MKDAVNDPLPEVVIIDGDVDKIDESIIMVIFELVA